MTPAGCSDQNVLTLCDKVWTWRLQESPELATFCGLYHYEDSWDDISTKAFIRRQGCVKTFLEHALQLDISNCSKDILLTHTVLVKDLKLYLEGCRFESYLFPINHLEGVHLESGRTISFMKYETQDDFEKYISRLQRLPHKINQTIALLREGLCRGNVAFASTVSRVPDQIASMVCEDNIKECSLLWPFRKGCPALSKEQIEQFHSEAKKILSSSVFPAFIKLKDYIEEEYLGACREKEGVTTLNDGSAWYQQCLNFHLSCNMTAQEVHDIGLRELARIKTRILDLAQVEDLGDNIVDVRKNIEKMGHNFFKSKKETLDYARNMCSERIRPQLPRAFKNLPETSMSIVEVPNGTEESPFAYYFNGTADGSRPGCFFINTEGFQKRIPYYFPSLCLHEGEPGHHLQDIYLHLSKDLPEFRKYFENGKYYLMPRKFSTNSAYYEGWGLYSEALGEELDIYVNNLELIGRLSHEIFRACRLIVDTGLHAFGSPEETGLTSFSSWSKAEAEEFLTQNTLVGTQQISAEVDRYICWPGQACSYKIGEMKILELRRKAEEALGSHFDLSEFHHCILSCGAVPLDVLTSIVDQFIQDNTVSNTHSCEAYQERLACPLIKNPGLLNFSGVSLPELCRDPLSGSSPDHDMC